MSNYIVESYWPQEGKYTYLTEGDNTIALTPYSTIEPSASLLCWRSTDLGRLLPRLGKLLPELPRPLYLMLPGPEQRVLATLPLFQKLGFCLDTINLEMILDELPEVAMPPGLESGMGQDFAGLAQLDLAHFPHFHQDEDTLRERAAAPDWEVISISAEGELAGMAVGQVYGKNYSHLFIRSLAIYPRFRGLGLSRKLVQGLFAWAYKQGARKSMLWLGGGEDNPVARSLYESLNFRTRDVEAQLSVR